MKKKKTLDIDPTYVRSKNNRLMLKVWIMWNNYTQFVKE